MKHDANSSKSSVVSRITNAVRLFVYGAVLWSLAIPAWAAFDSGSNGSDGALTLTTPGTLLFDPVALGLDADGDNIYHFTTINIGPGVIVKLSNRKINGPVYWLAKGDVVIEGTIDLNGEDGIDSRTYTNAASRIPAYPGAGGYPGGIGAFGGNLPQDGGGPGGGKANPSRSTSGGAAYSSTFTDSCGVGSNTLSGKVYGNNFLVPLIGGSGGGGGGSGGDVSCRSGGGGAGGGAILLSSTSSITLDSRSFTSGDQGNILAQRGGGASGVCTVGGSGSGGAVRLVTPLLNVYQRTPTIQVDRFQGEHLCRFGQDPRGGAGRIRIEAFQVKNLTLGTNQIEVRGTVSFGTPSNLFLPVNQPRLAAVSVDGKPVSSTPSGSFEFPDVTINQTQEVTVQIAAKDIPLGTVVKLHVTSENGNDQIIDSSPLTGILAESTATATVVLPPGYSRGFLRAVWNP